MPAWIKTGRDESLWKKAKGAVARKSGWTDSQYWGTVTKVYKNMGGAIRKGEKMCMACGSSEECKCRNSRRELMEDDEMLGKSMAAMVVAGKKVLLIKAENKK